MNPGYGGGRSMSAGSDNEIPNVHEYARFKDRTSKIISVNDETIAPTRRAARKRPILRSRRHTAHVLIKRITSNRIEIERIHAKHRVCSPSAQVTPVINSPICGYAVLF
jgi:hypothetical protein